MPKMTTSRCYWVDWICLFDEQPTERDVKQKYFKMKKYLENYLNDLFKKSTKSKGSSSQLQEDWEEWDVAKLRWIRASPPVPGKQKQEQSPKNWIKLLKMEWDQMNDKPRVYNFKAYFETNRLRYTGDRKGTLTPPTPPTPPGTL